MCRFCKDNAGYDLISPVGLEGAYYISTCKNCERGICSDIMHICNNIAEDNDDLETSLDGCFVVYSEDFVRNAIKEN